MAAVFIAVPEIVYGVAKAWQKVGGVSRIMMLRSDPAGCCSEPAPAAFFQAAGGMVKYSNWLPKEG
jgi:hypothetical protein